jgi:hypothetical protein
LIKHGRAADKGFPFGEKKMHTASQYVCCFIPARLLAGEGVDDFFKQRSSEEGNLICDGRGVLTRASAVWFSHES